MLRRHPNKTTLAAASAKAVRTAGSHLTSSSSSSSSDGKVVAGRRPRAFISSSFSSSSASPTVLMLGSSYHALRSSLQATQATTTTTESRRPLSTDRRIEDLVTKVPPPSFSSSSSSSLLSLATEHHYPSLLRGIYRTSTPTAPPPSSSSFASLNLARRRFASQPAAPKPDPVKDNASKAAPASSVGGGGGNTTGAQASAASSSNATPPPRYVEEGFKPEDLKPEQGVEDPRKEENSPSTVGGVVRRYTIKGVESLRALPGAVVSFTVMAGKYIVTFFVETVKNPSSLRDRWLGIKKVVVEELHHYKLGSKVLWSDIKTSSSIVSRLLHGHTLSRRERRQLTRTTADLFRLVPFAFFVIVPFMELLLPFALKVFPNMLPSTFQDNLKREENMKRELKVRLALAGFLKDTLGEIASKKKGEGGEEGGKEGGKESPNAALLTEFVEKARAGTHISTNDINRFARLFKDELTLDNMSRPQLAGMCVYMGLRPYGSDNFLRFQLRAKLRNLKEDDQRIVWEGVDNMTKAELREACRERGMRAYGLTQLGYRRQLQQWLDLSINKEVPISLLILSRAFTLDSKFTDPAAAVADSISSLDKDVVNEVLLDVATGVELRNPDLRARKLESIERQNELIEEERKREEARRKKVEEEKKKAEEEKKTKEKAAAEAAAAAAAAAAPAAVTDAQSAQVDTKQVTDAIANAAAMTGSAPTDGASHPKPAASESFPQEKVLTETEVVSKAMPSLETPSSSSTTTATTTPASAIETAAAAVTAAAQEVIEEQAEEAAKVEEQKKKKRELTVAEINALRTLVKESSVDQEKTVLAQLKAELQAAATAKAAEAAAKEEVVAASEAAPAAATAGGAGGAGTEGGVASGVSGGGAAPLDLTLPPPTFTSGVPDAAAALAATTTTPAAAAAGAGETPSGAAAAASTTSAVAVKAEEAKPVPAPSPPPSSSTSAMDKALERMRLKVASMLDKLEVDIEKVESTIGDKLHMLDKDKDGVLTVAELSEVISHVLKRHTSEEEAQKIANTMDKDADGILTVQELMEWIEHREELLEELGDDDSNSSSSSSSPAPPSKKPASPPLGAPPAPPAAPVVGGGATGGSGGSSGGGEAK